MAALAPGTPILCATDGLQGLEGATGSEGHFKVDVPKGAPEWVVQQKA